MNEKQKRVLNGLGFIIGVMVIGSILLTLLSPLFFLEFKLIRFLAELIL